MLPLLHFKPVFKERVWGGRNLERLYGKTLPPNVPIGESWEISDRPGDVSVVEGGPLAGRDLRWLMENHATDLLGRARSLNGRFPLLIKILDAQEDLSLQVHPPAARAGELKGEPKTEMWFITDARPDAALYVGLRPGVSREEFTQRIADGSVADCFHRHAVRAGDAMFLPSGRVHAIGGGNVIFEIQQNSDTTYRVFDWNRVGLDGKPRELHVEKSLASIDFEDFEPPLVAQARTENDGIAIRPLAACEHFVVRQFTLRRGANVTLELGQMHIIGVVSGWISVEAGGDSLSLGAGAFCVVPACLMAKVNCADDAVFVGAEAGA
jgi:mannose-6-phosphate isomerase